MMKSVPRFNKEPDVMVVVEDKLGIAIAVPSSPFAVNVALVISEFTGRCGGVSSMSPDE